MVKLFFVIAVGCAIYYGYEQGFFNSETALIEEKLSDMRDPRS